MPLAEWGLGVTLSTTGCRAPHLASFLQGKAHSRRPTPPLRAVQTPTHQVAGVTWPRSSAPGTNRLFQTFWLDFQVYAENKCIGV